MAFSPRNFFLFHSCQEMASATVDVALDKLGRNHIIIFVFAVTRGLPATWNMMMPVFVAPSNIVFHCAEDAQAAANVTAKRYINAWTNSTSVVDTNGTSLCYRWNGDQGQTKKAGGDLEQCSSWFYDRSVYGKTVNEEWDMVCDNRWMVSFVQSIFLAGLVVGAVTASHIADWFGRKKTLMGGLLFAVGASFMATFSTTTTVYFVSPFLMAIAVTGYADVIYTLMMETLSPRYRYIPGMMVGSGWTTGMVLVPWVAYLAKDWRITQLYAAVPLAPLLVLWCFLPESPRWLMATGQFPEAKKVVAKFAKHASMPPNLVDEIIDEAKRNKAASREVNKATIADLFSTKLLATITTLIIFQTVVSSLMWYRMTVSTASVGGNPYLNFTIAALSEYPVRLVNALIIKYCRRRPIICGTIALPALAMIAVCLTPLEYPWVRLGLLMSGKVGSSANNAVVDVYVSETYPTVVRSVAMGFCFTLGHVGSALAPFLDDLGHVTQPWVPNVVAAGLAVVGAGGCLLLPESFQRTLEDGFAKQDAAVKDATTTSHGHQQVYVVEATQPYAFPEDELSVLSSQGALKKEHA
ncbi:organic cation transporter protein-like [Haemaphysalis longicornis]